MIGCPNAATFQGVVSKLNPAPRPRDGGDYPWQGDK